MRSRRVACFILLLACSKGIIVSPAWAAEPERAADSSRAISKAEPALERAAQLRGLAEGRKLDAAGAAEAAGLLDHADPFVQGLAEWALATKVNLENNGQVAVWPQADPPAWYAKWMSLDGERLLTADYVRQAAVWDLHRQPQALAGSARKIVARAESVVDDLSRSDAAVERQQAARRQLETVRAIAREIAADAAAAAPDLPQLRRRWLDLRRAARPLVLSQPAADFERLAYVTRHEALFANITGSQYPWSYKPGGDICVQQGLHPGGAVQRVLDGQLGPGHVHGIDLGWDADRVVFGYARQPDWPPRWDTLSGDFVFLLRGDQPPTRLFEICLDGSGLKQLTDGRYWSDFEPTWCGDGSVVFASDRSGRSSECGKFSADHTVINLYRVFPGSGRIVRLNDNKDIDRYPHSLDNGLIAYTRWEYQERHFLETHAVWTLRPDGTMADAVFNQHLRAPYGLRDTRSVPGSQKLISIATGHHTLAYGPVVLIDGRRGINRAESLEIVTPHVVPQEGPMAGRVVASGGVPDRGGVYQTPWALSDSCFLAAYSYSSSPQAAGFAIYLLDLHGHKELLARDRLYSCSSPMPIRPRVRPPILPDVPAGEEATAECYLANVYEGLDGVARGEVKYLRIAQHVGWPLDERIGAMRYLPGDAWSRQFGHWNWSPVRVIGEVPVAPDGSAHFVVPANTSVYFQALDDQHMEIRRMRSHVTLQPGERRGCTGCHESQLRTPRADWGSALAWQQPAQVPLPPPWGAERLLGYEWLIQPIWDEHCTRCHSGPAPDGDADFTAARAADGFLQSYRTLFGRPVQPDRTSPVLVSVADRLSDSSVTQPRQFGSRRSRLIPLLRDDPLHRGEVQLSAEQWRALVTWIDANAPYYDAFYNRRPPGKGAPVRNILPRLPSLLAGEIAEGSTQEQFDQQGASNPR